MNNNINPQNIWILSALDKLISENKASPPLMCALYEKKQLVIQMIQNKKIDAHKYKMFVAKAFKEEAGTVKMCAEEDIHKLSNPKDHACVEQWFKELLIASTTPYQNQKKLYNYYKSQQAQTVHNIQPKQPTQPVQPIQPMQQPIQQAPKQAPGPPTQPQGAFDQLVSFKVIDSMLDDYSGPPDKFQQLMAHKKKMLSMVERKEITPQRYKNTLQVFSKRLTGTSLGTDYMFQLQALNDFHEGNIKAWFQQILDEAKSNLVLHNDKLETLKQGGSSKPQPSSKQSKPAYMKESYRASIRQSVKAHPKGTKQPFDIGQINSFRVFDEQMEEQTGNKENYKALLQKKKKFIDLAKKGSLTGDKYKALLLKSIGEATNEEIKESMGFQLSQLGEFHSNNVSAWWQDIQSNAQIMLQDQEKTMADILAGKKVAKKADLDDDAAMMKFLNGQEEDDDEDIDLDIDADLDLDLDAEEIKPVKKSKTAPKEHTKNVPAKKEEPIKASSPKKVPSSGGEGQIFSLKALDDMMSENEKNPAKFCELFERKKAIFDMMQSGQIDANKYKVLQEKAFATTTNAKLKECIEMDLFDLKDMCQGNVNQWFQALINDTGMNYEDQQQLYNKLKSGGQSKKDSVKSSQLPGEVKIKQVPNIAELVCFTAVDRLFQHCLQTADIVYYKELCNRRDKLIDLVNQGKLVPSKYKDINSAAAGKTQNTFLKTTIHGQLYRLEQQLNNDLEKWFQDIKKNLIAPPPQLKLPENPEMKRVNALPAEGKVKFLASKMVPYQSLAVYYKTNQITDASPALKGYPKAKKEAFKAIALLIKDPEFDVYNLAEQLFPQITAEVFYGNGNLPALKAKAQGYCKFLAQEVAAIKDWTTKIKKSTNPKNLQSAKKQITQCESKAVILKSWPGKELTPFPEVTQEKIEKYNLDLITTLDKNEVEVVVTYIEGLDGQSYLKIYAGGAEKERFWVKVKNGNQSAAKVVIKLTPKESVDLMRGDRPVIVARLFTKSFWGNMNQVGEMALLGTLIRHNVAQEKATDGHITLHFQLKVHKPSKPLVTEIVHTQVKMAPAFKVDKSLQKGLLKQCMAQLKE